MVLVNRCGMCKKDEESIDHLLLHCECVQFLWNASFSRFGLAWAMPWGVANLLRSWWLGGRPVVPWFGKWFHFALCGVYGLNVTEDFSKIPKEAWRISYYSIHLDGSLACPLSD